MQDLANGSLPEEPSDAEVVQIFHDAMKYHYTKIEFNWMVMLYDLETGGYITSERAGRMSYDTEKGLILKTVYGLPFNLSECMVWVKK